MGGVVKRGSKGHKLISSIQVSEILAPTCFWGRGGQGCIRMADNHRRSPPLVLSWNLGPPFIGGGLCCIFCCLAHVLPHSAPHIHENMEKESRPLEPPPGGGGGWKRGSKGPRPPQINFSGAQADGMWPCACVSRVLGPHKRYSPPPWGPVCPRVVLCLRPFSRSPACTGL